MKILGKLIDLHQRRIFGAGISLGDGRIISVEEREISDGVYILPGLIDSHVHIESSMLVPSAFSYEAARHGTVAVVADPHEIANVMGVKGIEFMLEDSEKCPLKFYFGAPSCVPATPFESSGAELGPDIIAVLLNDDRIRFLSEVMNFPGVINGDTDIVRKIEAAWRMGKRIDGHAPGLRGEALRKYCSYGITTDHESSDIEEAREKIACGMTIMIREGSAARNLEALHQLFNEAPEKIMLCCDDIHPEMLMKRHINSLVRELISKGYDMFDVLRAASLNPIEHYSLDVGTLRAGEPADFIIIDNPEQFNILETWVAGRQIYNRGKVKFSPEKVTPINNFTCSRIRPEQISFNITEGKIRVIGAVDGELITSTEEFDLSGENWLERMTDSDILKIVVKERYNDKPPTIGFITGFGIREGAIAGSVAHDSHNIVAVGASDNEIVNAINLVVDQKGGLSFCNGEDQFVIPLPVAGIMSDVPCGTIADKYEIITEKVKDTGCHLKAPFMTLSFMSLLVIPHLKIGDKGLFDVDRFEFVNLTIK